ncbi:MAG: ribosome biogenesis GTPase Der [Spirochaetaceae bacterium]|jgi:GTP-binding protein|nr:ribosome biogenesis GTPase Der [Spirochaetaceae bacterium]
MTFDTEKRYKNLPLMVIVGRPNVGKSTLFNRLVRSKRAITSPAPGVTRDPVEGVAWIAGKPLRVMDTGGFTLAGGGERDPLDAELDGAVKKKAFDAIHEAECVLLLLEAGLVTPEDEELLAALRPYWGKVTAAVNKTEGGRLAEESWNFARFGFKNLFQISAERGDNLAALGEAVVSSLDFSRVQEDEGQTEGPVRIAIMGRPNTGKSTLANRLTRSEGSIVSDKAGTTRDVVEGAFTYRGRDFRILDTAGIRRRARVTEDVEYYSVNRAIKTLESADLVFLLIDPEEGLTEQDKKIAALASEKGRGIILVFNKWDTQDKSKKFLSQKIKDIRVMFAHMDWAPVLAISARDGTGVKALLDTALTLHGQLTRRIETGALNRALKDWVAAYPPPASRVSHFALKYAVQRGANPVSFIIFASRPEAVPQSYLAYITNRTRSTLGFDNIPVLLELRGSRKKWEDLEKERRAQ